MEQYRKGENPRIRSNEVNLQKGQEIVEECISTIKVNVHNKTQTWAKIAKDAKAKVGHAKKEIKTNASN